MQFPPEPVTNYRNMNWLKGAGDDLCDCEITNAIILIKGLKGKRYWVHTFLGGNDKMQSEMFGMEAPGWLSQVSLDNSRSLRRLLALSCEVSGSLLCCLLRYPESTLWRFENQEEQIQLSQSRLQERATSGRRFDLSLIHPGLLAHGPLHIRMNHHVPIGRHFYLNWSAPEILANY